MLVGSNVRRVAIVGGMRIPFARAHGAYARAGNQDMLTAVLRGVVDRQAAARVRLGDVIAGAVLKHSKDFNLVRECVLSSGLDPQTPGLDIQRACGTSLEAAILVGNKIALNQIDAGIAAGVDTISDAPVVFPAAYRELLFRSFRGRNAWQRLEALVRSAPAAFQAGDTGRGRAAHRPVDGPELRTDGQDLEDQPRGPGRACAHRATCMPQPRGRQASHDDLVMPFLGLEMRQQRARRFQRRKARAAAYRVRSAAPPAHSPPATARRSPMAPQPYCWQARTGQRRATCR